MHSSIKQLFFIICFFGFWLLVLNHSGLLENVVKNPIAKYGLAFSAFLYIFRIISFIGLPVSLFLTFTSIFWTYGKPSDLSSNIPNLTLNGLLCFRIVTRGDYPDLVCQNIEILLDLLQTFHVNTFTIEVVANKSIELADHPKVRLILVPEDYVTRNGTKFKARNLQYALEDGVNNLSERDWIVHLDEDTEVTESSLLGILNFIQTDKHPIGQGVVTYGKGRVFNLLNTFADSFHVAVSLTGSRFCLRTFHLPGFVFKGSFIVCKASVEKQISFDFGLAGSISEDTFFAIKAANMGYSFDWIEGEMREQSTCTLIEFIRQRKRWIQGLYLVHNSESLKLDFNCLGFRLIYLSWLTSPIQMVTWIVLIFYPISFFTIDRVLPFFNLIAACYLFGFGILNSFDFKKRSRLFVVFCFLGTLVWIQYWQLAESFAICWAFVSNKDEFYVVQKSTPSTSVKSASISNDDEEDYTSYGDEDLSILVSS